MRKHQNYLLKILHIFFDELKKKTGEDVFLQGRTDLHGA